MTFVKICGITNLEDAAQAAGAGADALGFIFASSPRRITPEKAQKIIRQLPRTVLKVGVFVNEMIETVNRIAAETGIDIVQLHGTESPAYCRSVRQPVIKAISGKESAMAEAMKDYPAVTILLDSGTAAQAGGTGKTFRWEAALEARKKRNFILSGGLKPANVKAAISLLQPMGVDACSGVESFPGKKDFEKITAFITEVREADRSVIE